MIAGTMAVYGPYSGGRPAMLAYATACVAMMIVSVRPAIRSARTLPRLTIGLQRNFGMSLWSRTSEFAISFKQDRSACGDAMSSRKAVRRAETQTASLMPRRLRSLGPRRDGRTSEHQHRQQRGDSASAHIYGVSIRNDERFRFETPTHQPGKD